MADWGPNGSEELDQIADNTENIDISATDNRQFNFESHTLLQDISKKLSIIIKQNNEAFNQREKE